MFYSMVLLCFCFRVLSYVIPSLEAPGLEWAPTSWRNLTTGRNNYIIYTIILLKSVLSVCRAQTTGRNSCSVVLGDISNCSYRLSFLPLTSLHLSSGIAYKNYRQKTPKNYHENRVAARVFSCMNRRSGDKLNGDACGHG